MTNPSISQSITFLARSFIYLKVLRRFTGYSIAAIVALACLAGCSRTQPREDNRATSQQPSKDDSESAPAKVKYFDMATLPDYSSYESWKDALNKLNGKLIRIEGIVCVHRKEDDNGKDPQDSASVGGVDLHFDMLKHWEGWRVVLRGKLTVDDLDERYRRMEEEHGDQMLTMRGGGMDVDMRMRDIESITFYPVPKEIEKTKPKPSDDAASP